MVGIEKMLSSADVTTAGCPRQYAKRRIFVGSAYSLESLTHAEAASRDAFSVIARTITPARWVSASTNVLGNVCLKASKPRLRAFGG